MMYYVVEGGGCEGKGGRLKVRERVGGVVRVRCEKGGRELSERRLKRREKGKKRKREGEKSRKRLNRQIFTFYPSQTRREVMSNGVLWRGRVREREKKRGTS